MTNQPTYVYVAESSDGLLKIGCTSRLLPRLEAPSDYRIQQLANQFNVGLRLVAAELGDVRRETALHERYAQWRVRRDVWLHREWYLDRPEIRCCLSPWLGTPVAAVPHKRTRRAAPIRLAKGRLPPDVAPWPFGLAEPRSSLAGAAMTGEPQPGGGPPG